MNVEDAMVSEVLACLPGQALIEVARCMSDRGVGCAPVLANDGTRRVVGMLTDRDICRAAATQAEPLDRLRVEGCMSRTVRSCRFGDSVHAAAAIMRAYGLRRLPVVDEEGHLRGLIALSDIARDAVQGEISGEGHLPPSEIVETLAAMGRADPERGAADRKPEGRAASPQARRARE